MGKVRSKKNKQHREDLTSQVIGINHARPSKRKEKNPEIEMAATSEVSIPSKHKNLLLNLDEEEWPELGQEDTCATKMFTEYQDKSSMASAPTSTLLDLENDENDEFCIASSQNMTLTEEEKMLLECQENAPSNIRIKITKKQADIESQLENETICDESLTPQLKEYCAKIGKTLSSHRNGALPKFVQRIPRLYEWEAVLEATNPDDWTAKAMADMTKIFASKMTIESIAVKFFSTVLLPRVRDDIYSYQKLNPHLYQALFKTMYRPGCFNKGILFPLCSSGDCTLREAIIISSVLAKGHMPMNHTGAAIIYLCKMEYTGANSIFLTKFFTKGLNLPLGVIDEVIAFFMRYNGRWASAHKKELPVLWFQSLLCFVQNYKEWITDEAKMEFRDLLKGHYHHEITPLIQRELDKSLSRRTEPEEIRMDLGIEDV